MIPAAALITFAASPAVLAKAPAKPKTALPHPEVYAKYDTDHNHIINVAEGDSMKSDFTSNPNDAVLKPLDTNHDSKLDDKEVMAIAVKAPAPKPAKPKPAKNKKK